MKLKSIFICICFFKDLPMARECCLSDLLKGARACVRTLTGDAAERNRLLSIGFTPGTMVEVKGCDAEHCCVFLRNCSVVLGGSVARRIVCEADDGAVPPASDSPGPGSA